MTGATGIAEFDPDREVVVVGGGPAGCSAGVFAARYGFDTLVFDRGNAALDRCGYLENYLGFPGGIDVGAFQDLAHAHAREAGCELVEEMVVSVDRPDDGREFVVETDEGRRLTAGYVVAAAWYDGSYLRGLDAEDAMFESHEHHGELEERFDPDYPDEDGRTPVEGLYVAGPAGDRSAQAVVAAGHGAHVARCLIEDHRRGVGYSGGVAPEYDWVRPETEFAGEWGDRERWQEWFDAEIGDDHGLDDDRVAELREAYIDRAFDSRVDPADVEERSARGVRKLVEVVGLERILDAIDDERILDTIDDERILDAIDDETIDDYRERRSPVEPE